MATTLKYGSKGDEVSSLQQMLNNYGYGLAVDGSYGPLTQAAVRDYQAKNGLSVDGIVGVNTWGALNSNTGSITPAQAQATAGGSGSGSSSSSSSSYSYMTPVENFDWAKPGYSESQKLTEAGASLQSHIDNRPGEYQSPYGAQIQGMLDKLLNRPDFNYDVTKDPLYAQYSEQYQRLGQKAMMDTMGQAAGLTGGYGNTYAQTAGQQSYQDYLERLNGAVPDLYNAAYARYQGQGDDLRQNMGLLQGLEDTEYGRYRDTLGDFNLDRDYLTNRYDTQAEREYKQFLDEYAQWQNARDFSYQQQQDRQAQANWERELALAASKKSGGGGGSKASQAAQVPTSSNEFIAVTGNANIMTEQEFYRRVQNGGGSYNGLKTYQQYLNANWAKYN